MGEYTRFPKGAAVRLDYSCLVIYHYSLTHPDSDHTMQGVKKNLIIMNIRFVLQ
mgnify:FL=1